MPSGGYESAADSGTLTLHPVLAERARHLERRAPRGRPARGPEAPANQPPGPCSVGCGSGGPGNGRERHAGSTPPPPGSQRARLRSRRSRGSLKPSPLQVLEERLGSSPCPPSSPAPGLRPSLRCPTAHSTASRGWPERKRSAMPSTNRYARTNSERSRVAKASYSAHSRSVTSETAVREIRSFPLASSRSASSMSRVEDPGVHLHHQPLELLGPSRELLADLRVERLVPIRHLRPPYSTIPSAVAGRPIRVPLR